MRPYLDEIGFGVESLNEKFGRQIRDGPRNVEV